VDSTHLALLRTPAGQEALAAASGLLEGDRLAAASALRAQFGADLAAAALTQATLRQRATAKFGADASEMYFTRAGLEQATRAIVAERRAWRLREAGAHRVADLGCGIGGDLRAFTSAGLRAHGIDADAVTAACAALNAPSATVSAGDVQDLDLTRFDAVFCDPARRSGNRRVFTPSDYSPPWEWVSALPGLVPSTVLKLAPGIDQALLPRESELELVSVDGEVVEATAWCGPLVSAPRRATVIRHETAHELTGSGLLSAPAGIPRAYVYDPDGAVVRSHLVAELAAQLDACLADETIAYLWADRPLRTAFARCFEVDEVLPFSLKRLRAALRARDVGRVEILKRGSPLDVQALRRELRLSGANEASVLLTRVKGDPVAVIARSITRDR
jgi:THUMP domain-like/Methyltransferase domain